MQPVGIAVYTRQDPENSFAVHEKHYDVLHDALDRGEQGWVEYDSVFGTGKVMFRLQDVIAVVFHTDSMVKAMDDWNTVNG